MFCIPLPFSIQKLSATHVEVISFQIIRRFLRQQLSLRIREGDLQGFGDLLRNFILDIKYVFDQTVEPFGPQVITISDVDELCGDADLFTCFSNTSLQDVIYAKSFTYLPRVYFLVTKWKDVSPRNNLQFLNL